MVMKINTFGYCLEQGVINLLKNRLMTLASIGTISTCLLVIGIFYTIVSNVDYMIASIQNNIGIAIFFEDGISERQIAELKSTIDKREEVYSITYISADQAWESFKEDYFKDKEELLDGFEEDNPLEDSASFQVFLADISKQEQLVNYVSSLSGVRYVREDRQVTDIISSISDLIKYFSIVLVVVLIIVSVFLISNTVRLAIELRKVEINIMKYVGATDAFIRGPFIIEGATIGLLGAFLPLILIFTFYKDVTINIVTKFIILDDYLVFMPIEEIFTRLLPLSIIIGAGIGIVGSMMTIHKHLKV